MLADRLSTDGRNEVVVSEYGSSDRLIFIQMPSALTIPINTSRYNWRNEAEPALVSRKLPTPRGKGLGYANLLPYFRRADTRDEGGDACRGHSGPLHTRSVSVTNPLHAAWIRPQRWLAMR